jgi:hypothetical protein
MGTWKSASANGPTMLNESNQCKKKSAFGFDGVFFTDKNPGALGRKYKKKNKGNRKSGRNQKSKMRHFLALAL